MPWRPLGTVVPNVAKTMALDCFSAFSFPKTGEVKRMQQKRKRIVSRVKGFIAILLDSGPEKKSRTNYRIDPGFPKVSEIYII
jgi:hypothetical protein